MSFILYRWWRLFCGLPVLIVAAAAPLPTAMSDVSGEGTGYSSDAVRSDSLEIRSGATLTATPSSAQGSKQSNFGPSASSAAVVGRLKILSGPTLTQDASSIAGSTWQSREDVGDASCSAAAIAIGTCIKGGLINRFFFRFS